LKIRDETRKKQQPALYAGFLFKIGRNPRCKILPPGVHFRQNRKHAERNIPGLLKAGYTLAESVQNGKA